MAWYDSLTGGGSRSIPSDVEVVGPSDTFTGVNRGNAPTDASGKPISERAYAEQGGAMKKPGIPDAGKGGKKEKPHDQPASAGSPNLGGSSGPGTQGWEKPRAGTSPKLPWDDRPGPTVPSMAPIDGSAKAWHRTGYHALPDPTKALED